MLAWKKALSKLKNSFCVPAVKRCVPGAEREVVGHGEDVLVEAVGLRETLRAGGEPGGRGADVAHGRQDEGHLFRQVT